MATPTIKENPLNPQISEILKRVDGLLKKEDIDAAKAEVAKATKIDPRNMYVHAYFERIELLLADRKRKREAEESHRKSEEEARKRAEAERKKRLEEETKRKLDAEAARNITRKEETTRKPDDQEAKQGQSRPAPTPAIPEQASRPHADEIEEYRTKLFEAWKEGIPGPAAATRLGSLRAELHVSLAEHKDLEESAKRESYVMAFRNLWSANNSPGDGPDTITALHRKFGITADTFDKLDLVLLREIKVPRIRPQLVVIDDDQQLLTAMAAMLEDHGLEVYPFTTSDEAFRFLSQSTPDLILADINLESSTMGGFAFFQKLQEIPRLASLPFIFVSGLTDEVVMRTGKALGADDYVTKPFVGETLLSIIKGKLRRYEELKHIRPH